MMIILLITITTQQIIKLQIVIIPYIGIPDKTSPCIFCIVLIEGSINSTTTTTTTTATTINNDNGNDSNNNNDNNDNNSNRRYLRMCTSTANLRTEILDF